MSKPDVPERPGPPEQRRRPALRRRATILFVALCAAVLAACGAKIDTVFTLEEDESGSREMTLSLSQDDFAELTEGDARALERSIADHVPDELGFDGLDEDDGGLTTTFTLGFDSEQDYLEKVRAVLEAGGVATTPRITLTAQDTAFIDGGIVTENFTSYELLTWLPDGLVADGLIDEQQRSVVLDSAGETVVRYDGKERESYQPIRFESVRDHGLRGVDMRTVLLEDGGFEREITYEADAEIYESREAEYDAFFDGLALDEGDLTQQRYLGDAISWHLRFTAADEAELAAATAAALGGGQATLSVTEEPSGDQPTTVTTTVIDDADCSALCSPHGAGLSDTLVVPETWGLEDDTYWRSERDEPGMRAVEVTPSPEGIVFRRHLPVDAVVVETALHHGGGITQTLHVAVPSENVALAGDGFDELLTPPAALGSLAVDEGEETTTYAVTLEADDPDQYNAAIADYLPGAGLALATDDGWLRAHRSARIKLDLESLFGTTPVTDGVAHAITAPRGQTIARGDGRSAVYHGAELYEIDEVGVSIGGWTLTGLITGGVVGLLLLLGAGAALLFPDRAADAWATVRKHGSGHRHGRSRPAGGSGR